MIQQFSGRYRRVLHTRALDNVHRIVYKQHIDVLRHQGYLISIRSCANLSKQKTSPRSECKIAPWNFTFIFLFFIHNSLPNRLIVLRLKVMKFPKFFHFKFKCPSWERISYHCIRILGILIGVAVIAYFMYDGKIRYDGTRRKAQERLIRRRSELIYIVHLNWLKEGEWAIMIWFLTWLALKQSIVIQKKLLINFELIKNFFYCSDCLHHILVLDYRNYSGKNYSLFNR